MLHEMCPLQQLGETLSQWSTSAQILNRSLYVKRQNPSLWLGTTAAPRFESLRNGVHVDVAIVGAGITGITAALLLKQRGRKVAVLEKERIGGGETGNTTAHITEAVDARYHSIAKDFSKEAAKLVAEASHASIEQIATLVRQYSIDCGFRRVPGYLYTERRKDVAELKKEAVAAAEAGVKTRWVEDVPLPFETRGAVLFEDQAQFHPLAYLLALAKQVPGDGSFIFDETFVTEIREGEPCVVETASGSITADVVVQATNAPITGFTKLHTQNASYRSYAIAYRWTGSHPEGLFWDTDDPYHYTRWQETAEGVFLIVGGADHRVGNEDENEAAFPGLEKYAREHFGDRLEEAYRWSGQILEPVDGLPFIGGNAKVVTSTGYAGQGMTFGTVGAMVLTDLITGTPNRWADLFDANRKHVRGALTDFVTENVDFPKHFIRDRILRRDVETHETGDVARGDGRIVSIKGKKLAVFRGDDGHLQALSPVCTHMGCDVHWNCAERSWDCPCHGSRFTVTGDVLNGPARKGLEKIELED